MTKNNIWYLVFFFGIISCNQDDKPALTVVEEIEYGAVIRTIEVEQGEFYVGEAQGLMGILIEEQDEGNGSSFQSLDIYLTFVDNTPENGNFSTSEALLETQTPDLFSSGPPPESLPRNTLQYSFAELASAAGISVDQVLCKDQFMLRLAVNLTDGRTFTTTNSSSFILGQRTFFSSPFCYLINVVEPIAEDSFRGMYTYESILDGPFGPSFGPSKLVEIEKGHSNNVRYVTLKYNRAHPTNEPDRIYEFTIACDESVFLKNQFTSPISGCNLSEPILLGPDTVNATINPNDDSVFEVWFVEGYNGWDGSCGFGTAKSRMRFTKQ